ncbi:MAG: tetratricopeptide repeat protein [Chloroflexi bacterium]|nr:tetratricopeptide repeat protein [Chloroflexota bacterium]
MAEQPTTFAELLREHRFASGLTQVELAQRAGLSERAISDLERGLKAPHRSTVRVLARALALPGQDASTFEAAHRKGGQNAHPRGGQAPGRDGTLPRPLTSFVGRERELGQLEQLLAGSRLLTLTGAGGSGKTRLALHLAMAVAERFEHGVVFVPLASVFDAGLVLPTVAQALGLAEIGPREPLAALGDYLQTRHLLLLLDNFEHLLSAGPALMELLGNCPRLKLLVTSRSPLRLSAEQEYEVPPLTVPDARWLDTTDADPVAVLQCSEAVRLFVERARAIKPDFAVTAHEADAMANICRHVDGLPLAIELAAARVRFLPLATIAARFAGTPWQRHGSPLQLLAGGVRDLPARQQTLRATIAWSYDLLTTSEQALFRWHSIFFGGASLEAIHACAAAAGIVDREWTVATDDVLTDVEALVAKSLLVRRRGPGGEPSFDMLETIREFGLERLRDAGALDSARRWHAGHYLMLTEQAEPHLRSADQRAWLDRLEAEHDNLRAALEWALTNEEGATGLRLSGALAWFWLDRGYTSEGRRWLDRTLAAAGGTPAARLKALCGAGWLAHVQRDARAARAHLDAAVALACELGDRWALAWARHVLGRVAYFSGDATTARTLAEQSLVAGRELGDEWLVAWALHLLGLAAHIAGRYAEARAHYQQALSIRRRIDHVEGTGICLVLLAMVAYREDSLDEARTLAHESLVTLRELEARWTVHNPLVTLAVIAGAMGKPEQAVRLAAATEAFSQVVDVAPVPLAETMLRETLARARSRLGEATYTAAWAAGRALSLAEAVAEALALSSAPQPSPSARASPASALTPREAEVLRLIAGGQASKEIALALAVSVTTVERHITHVYDKLGVRGRAEATAYALRHGLA